jgi:hypothetical protein
MFYPSRGWALKPEKLNNECLLLHFSAVSNSKYVAAFNLRHIPQIFQLSMFGQF